MADAWAINSSGGTPAYTAAELRRMFASLSQPQSSNRFGAVQGVRPGGGVITSLAGSTITVQAHAGMISPDLTTTQSAYFYQLDVNETHALTPAHLTLARTDLVYIQVSDQDEDGSGLRQVVSGYLAGTAGAGVPSLPARSFEIARIAVPASGGGSPALTERAKYTVASGGVLPVRDTADLPSHYESRVAAQLDTDRLMISDGSAWQRGPHWSVAGRTGCRLYQDVEGILNATAGELVTWDVEDQDTDGFISVPGTTITVPAGLGGLYAITYHVIGSFSGTHSFLQLNMSSSLTHLPSFFRAPMEPQDDRGLLTITVPLLAGDSFTCQIYHETGSATGFECFLSAYRLAV